MVVTFLHGFLCGDGLSEEGGRQRTIQLFIVGKLDMLPEQAVNFGLIAPLLLIELVLLIKVEVSF